MSMSWNALHFVRPDALWALLALPLLVAVWWLRRRRANVWRQTVDAHLLRHLLVGRDRRAWGGLILLLLGTAIAIVALAGPSWRQVARPGPRPPPPPLRPCGGPAPSWPPCCASAKVAKSRCWCMPMMPTRSPR